jgi:hypothetical protein
VSQVQLIPDSHLAEPQLDQLRAKAQDLARAEDWAALSAIRPELGNDSSFWPDMWGPLCAIAARQAGEPGAVDLLADLVQGGFCQPELFDGKLESVFADDPRWPGLSGVAGAGTARAGKRMADRYGDAGLGHRPVGARQRAHGSR